MVWSRAQEVASGGYRTVTDASGLVEVDAEWPLEVDHNDLAAVCRAIYDTASPATLLWLGVGVFVVAWIGQFIGHSKLYEGKRPSFFTDLRYLLIGPAWVLAKLYRKLGWSY